MSSCVIRDNEDNVTEYMLKQQRRGKWYCRSGNVRVFKFSRITDIVIFVEFSKKNSAVISPNKL